MFIINNHYFGLFFLCFFILLQISPQNYNFFLTYANKKCIFMNFFVFFRQKVPPPLSDLSFPRPSFGSFAGYRP